MIEKRLLAVEVASLREGCFVGLRFDLVENSNVHWNYTEEGELDGMDWIAAPDSLDCPGEGMGVAGRPWDGVREWWMNECE